MAKDAKSSPIKKTKATEKDPFLKEQGQTPRRHDAGVVGCGRKILVVDDNEVVLKAFATRLKADGFGVVTLTNAAAVANTAEEEKVELIVLDINFPAGGAMEWSGFTVIQWLRRFPELSGIPIILISGSEAAQYKEKALQAGALAFFDKPVDYQALLATILEALPRPGTHDTKPSEAE